MVPAECIVRVPLSIGPIQTTEFGRAADSRYFSWDSTAPCGRFRRYEEDCDGVTEAIHSGDRLEYFFNNSIQERRMEQHPIRAEKPRCRDVSGC